MPSPAGRSLTVDTLTRRSFVRTATALAALAPLASRAQRPADTPLYAYVGTYSAPPPGGPGANGGGIHIFRMDRETGALTPVGVTPHHTSPSAIVVNAAGTHLYTTNASDEVDEGSGTVSAYAIDRASGGLSLLGTTASGGAGPTYAHLHRSGRFLLVANYGGGTVAVLPIASDGRIGAAVDVKKTEGTVGPTRAASAPPGSFAISGHDRPHAHQVFCDAAGRFAFVPDLGLDRIFIWGIDEASGRLTPADEPSVAFPPGDGPRHGAFHPNGRWLYSIQEEGSTVVLLDYDAVRGRLTPRQTISSLPAGYAGSNFTSGIAVAGDGRYVYAANRLHDSIAIFAVGADGTLRWVAEEWTRGDYPRSFTIAPGGRFLHCCNQRADHVTTFRVDASTGRLTFTGQYTPVGSPSSMAFHGATGA